MTVLDAERARRRAVLLMGVLAATLLLAGLLPWVTAGPWLVRLLGLPLLLAGLLVAGAALRVRAVPQARQQAPSAPPVERGCDGCVCGIGGGCAAPSGQRPAEG